MTSRRAVRRIARTAAARRSKLRAQRALDAAVADAFDGARVDVTVAAGRFDVALTQPGMLRPLASAELSDGTLRDLLLVAALLTPRPPRLMVLNEPETSLHPDLLAPLARLVRRAARSTQLVVVSHAVALIAALAPRDPGGDSDDVDPAATRHIGDSMGIANRVSSRRPAWRRDPQIP